MKKFFLLAGVASLAACSQPAPEAVEEEPAVEEVAVSDDVGTYDVTDADGNSWQTVINADGTYANSTEGEDSNGSWRRDEEGKMCFTSAAEGAEESCWTDSEPGEDGSWVATGPEGETVTVRRVAEEAPPAVEEAEG